MPTIRADDCFRSIAEAYGRAPCAGPVAVELFAAHPLVEDDPAKALRVSRYLGEDEESRHVRFSVWSGGSRTPRAEAAVSLTDDEAERLARFLADSARVADQPTV